MTDKICHQCKKPITGGYAELEELGDDDQKTGVIYPVCHPCMKDWYVSEKQVN